MNKPTTERPNCIDIAKVFMIYLVVLGHYTYALDLEFKPSNVWSLIHIITLFHMPFFFVVSGLLFKCMPVKETIKKGWIQLMRPYLIMCLISCVIMVAVDLFHDTFSIKTIATLGIGVLSGNDGPFSAANWSSALWFCYALMIIKIVIAYLQQNRYKIVAGGGYFLLIVSAVIVLYKGNILPLRIDSSFVGMFFFCIGYFMKDFILKLPQSKIGIRVAALSMALFLLFLAGYYNLDFEYKQGLSINACYFGKHPWLFLVSGLSGTLAVMVLASFGSFQNTRAKKIVMQISNGTIVILGFHWVVYKLVFSWWLTSYNVFTAVCVALADLMVCYFIILIAYKYCPALLGYRKLS